MWRTAADLPRYVLQQIYSEVGDRMDAKSFALTCRAFADARRAELAWVFRLREALGESARVMGGTRNVLGLAKFLLREDRESEVREFRREVVARLDALLRGVELTPGIAAFREMVADGCRPPGRLLDSSACEVVLGHVPKPWINADETQEFPLAVVDIHIARTSPEEWGTRTVLKLHMKEGGRFDQATVKVVRYYDISTYADSLDSFAEDSGFDMVPEDTLTDMIAAVLGPCWAKLKGVRRDY